MKKSRRPWNSATCFSSTDPGRFFEKASSCDQAKCHFRSSSTLTDYSHRSRSRHHRTSIGSNDSAALARAPSTRTRTIANISVSSGKRRTRSLWHGRRRSTCAPNAHRSTAVADADGVRQILRCSFAAPADDCTTPSAGKIGLEYTECYRAGPKQESGLERHLFKCRAGCK